MKFNLLKVAGITVAVAGFGLSLISSWIDDKNLDEKVEEQVNRALAEKQKGEES